MKKKLAHIDALRGIAILLVILVHTAQSVPELPKWALKITKYGQLGVQLFFVVSAVTLSTSADQRSGEQDKTKKYFIRRFFRIAPLYYAGILWYLVFYSAQASIKSGQFQIAQEYTLINLLTNFLFVHGFYRPAYNYIVPGGWSIGTEMVFYVCFPLLFYLFKSVSKKGLVKFLLTFILFTAFYYVFEYLFTLWVDMPVQKNNFMYYNLLNQMPVFTLGLLAYFLSKDQIASKLPLLFDFFFLLLFAWATYFLWTTDLPVINSFMLLPFAVGAAFMFLYRIFARVDFLNFRVLQKIGQVSYSMYIFHFMFAWHGAEYIHSHIGQIGRPLILFGIYYLSTVMLAYLVALLSERYIEQPGIHLGKRIIQKMDMDTKDKALAAEPPIE